MSLPPAPAPSVHWEVLNYFDFWPARGIIIVALVLYPLMALTTLGVTIWTRRWYMIIATSVAIEATIGYAFRIRMLTHPVYGYYVAMQCLLIIPPSFLAIVQYVTLGKAVALIREKNPGLQTVMKPKLIRLVYLLIELGSLGLQGAGAGISVNRDDGPDNSESAGKALLLTGLALLVACIVSFYLNTIYIHWKPQYGVEKSPNLKAIFYTLYVTSTLLLARNIFRLIEFAGGWYGSLATQEKYFWSLDSLLVFLILFCFSFSHYGIWLNRYEREGKEEFKLGSVEMA